MVTIKMITQKTYERIATVGILALVLGIANFIVFPQQEAWALSRPNITPSGNFNNIQFTKFVPNNSGPTQYLAIGNASAVSPANSNINVYNANSTAFIGSMNFAGALGTIDATHSWTLNNVSCDKTGNSQLCAAGFTPSASVNSIVIMFDVGKQVVSNNNTRFAILTGAVPIVSVFNDGTQTHVYVEYRDSNLAQTHVLRLAVNTTQSLTDTKNRLVQQLNIISNVDVSGIANEDTAVVSTGANTGQWIMYMNAGSVQMWQISSMTRTCGANLAGGGNAGDIDYVSDSTGTYWLASDQVVNLYKIDFACNLVVNNSFPNPIYSISHNSGRGEVYLAQSNNVMLVVNQTTLSTTTLASYGVTAPAPHFNNIATDNDYVGASFQPNNPFVALGGSGHPAVVYMFYWQLANGAGGGGSAGGNNTCNSPNGQSACVGQTDCSAPANLGLAMCVLHNNPNNNPLVANGAFITTNAGGIICSLGLANCTNTNIKTNGEGYLFVIIGLLIIIALALYASKMILSIPVYYWFLMTLLWLGFSVAVGWLDITWLFVAVIAMVALGSGKIKNLLFGEGGFV